MAKETIAYSLSEMKDKYIGKPNSKERQQYENELRLELQAIKKANNLKGRPKA